VAGVRIGKTGRFVPVIPALAFSNTCIRAIPRLEAWNILPPVAIFAVQGVDGGYGKPLVLPISDLSRMALSESERVSGTLVAQFAAQ